jgi:hypothetical protein
MSTANGAGDHYEATARTRYHARSFGWLGTVLGTGLNPWTLNSGRGAPGLGGPG